MIKRIFYGKVFHSFIWQGRVCWIGAELAEMIDYKDGIRTINDFIRVKDMRASRDYDSIVGRDLEVFKNLFDGKILDWIKPLNRVIIFYESGVCKFLEHTRKPLAPSLDEWLKGEIIPILNEQKAVSLNELSFADFPDMEIDMDMGNDIYRVERMKAAVEGAKLLKALLDEANVDAKCKLDVIRALFSEAGIELPIYFNKI